MSCRNELYYTIEICIAKQFVPKMRTAYFF
uniref:Uncharacterized protein n=1 Tax=Siphoviridae sp. ct0uL16 TaxID=2825299 RepID=A0A8S5Q617_9CAUD|nr:MAG TPA: hypothetical protein [Siphoviridae sp. ct0uL16]